MADGIDIYWVRINVDGVHQISGGVPHKQNIANNVSTVRRQMVTSDEGTIYFSGDTPNGELTFGIAGHDGGFIPFPNGNFSISKTIKHGYGVVILCNAVGVTSSGNNFYIAYAGRN